MWATKPGKTRNYIVLKHTLKGINTKISNIKFRNGYAVVDKDSKNYKILKKSPMLRAAKEFPLEHLRTLPFITRAKDIIMIYGQDVYNHYMKFLLNEQLDAELEDLHQMEKEEAVKQAKRLEELQKITEIEEKLEKSISKEEKKELIKELPKIIQCRNTTNTGTLCKFEAIEESPNGYCALHIFNDPKVKELGIEKPKFLPKHELKPFRDKVIQKLGRIKESQKALG